MPRVHKTRRDVCPRAKQEAGEVCDGFVAENIDCGEDDESDERDAQSATDVESAFPEVITAISYTEQDNKSHSIGRHGPEISFDDRVS